MQRMNGVSRSAWRSSSSRRARSASVDQCAFRQEMVQRLRIGLHRLGDARQGLALGLGEQSDMQQGELLELAHVGKQTRYCAQ